MSNILRPAFGTVYITRCTDLDKQAKQDPHYIYCNQMSAKVCMINLQ